MLTSLTPIQKLVWIWKIQNSSSQPEWDTISNVSVATFTAAKSAPLKLLEIAITSVQAAGTPTPTSPLPISGWTGANITVSPTLDAQDGTVYQIPWQSDAGTVYGGTLNVTTGALTVTHMSVDMGTLSWSRAKLSGTDDIYRFMANGSNFEYPMAVATKSPEVICSTYKSVATSNLKNYDKSVTTTNSYPNIYVRDDDYSTAPTFKTAVSGVQIVYRLATPLTYQLTPNAIKTLLGNNNIWADTGDIVELTYRKK